MLKGGGCLKRATLGCDEKLDAMNAETLRLKISGGFERLWCGLLCVLNREVHPGFGRIGLGG
jgi:hypothetical protein